MDESRVLQDLQVFVTERDWEQFHTAEHLAMSISIQAGELLECFQWGAPSSPAEVKAELADVLTYCYLLAARLGVKPTDIVAEKLEVTRAKYPVDKSRGRSDRYDRL